jgi:hypothetical protein
MQMGYGAGRPMTMPKVLGRNLREVRYLFTLKKSRYTIQ